MKKTLLTIAAALLLVFASVMGTMAYLTSTDTVTNTFTVGNVKINLDEAKVDTNGSKVTSDGSDVREESANSYHLYPGHTYVKDPTVTVLTGSDEAYVKMVVTVTAANELDALFAELAITGTKLTDVVTGYNENNWKCHSNIIDGKNNTRTYEFWYKETVAAPTVDVKLDALFDEIKVPGSVTDEQLESLKIAGFQITVTAHAIQADGFADAAAAWAAYSA